MKKLAKKLDKFANTYQIKLSKWTRGVLYDFITKLAEEIRDNEQM